jgi:proline iminopeptidase
VDVWLTALTVALSTLVAGIIGAVAVLHAAERPAPFDPNRAGEGPSASCSGDCHVSRSESAMHVEVNGTRLWFDVDGPALVPDGSEMRQRPTVVLVHGGPGVWDHSYFKPDFAPLLEHAQVVYLDLPGHGRSDWGDVATFSFDACADDVRVFCDALGIAFPIVFGHSMGGPIVLLYGARHPGHAGGLVVQSGFARFDVPRLVEGFRAVAGDAVAEIAGRSFRGEEVADADWSRVSAAFGPHVPGKAQGARPRKNLELNAPGMELVRRVDILDQLGCVQSPTLVLVGELDPVTPVAAAEEIVDALPGDVGQLEVIEGAGHWAWKDAPDRFWPVLTEFIHRTTARERVET